MSVRPGGLSASKLIAISAAVALRCGRQQRADDTSVQNTDEQHWNDVVGDKTAHWTSGRVPDQPAGADQRTMSAVDNLLHVISNDRSVGRITCSRCNIAIISRRRRVAEFTVQLTWRNKLQSVFLQRDRVVFLLQRAVVVITSYYVQNAVLIYVYRTK